MPRARIATATGLALLVLATATGTGTNVTPSAAATSTYASSARLPIGQTTELGDGSGMITIRDYSTSSGYGTGLPYPSAAPINGLVGTVSDVVVHVENFSHRYPADVDMMLVAPSGERAVLMSDQGGSDQVTDVDLTFDQTASSKIPDTQAVTSGTYFPSNTIPSNEPGDYYPAPAPPSPLATNNGFAALLGAEPNGNWSLYVVDDVGGGAGSILSWSITVTTTGLESYPSTIDVAGASGSVTDVDVHLDDLSHGYPEDVDLLLVGPQGQQATLLSDIPQSAGIEDVDLTFDDAAPGAVSKPIVSGSFRPTNLGTGTDDFPAPAPTATGAASLSVFNGTDPNGTWRLYAADDGPGDHGGILGWSLRISTTDSPTPTPTTPTAGDGRGGTDTTAPRVSATRPATGAKAVRRGADVTATLSEAVRRASLTRSSAYLIRKGSTKRLAATVTWQPGTKRLVIDPSRRLRAGTTYKAVVTTALRDLAGNRLDQNPARAGLQAKTWRFTTR